MPLTNSKRNVIGNMSQAKLRFCEPCRKYKRNCNSQRPSCSNCIDFSDECVYGYHSIQIVDQFITSSRSVFTTQNARRLSSGSACETCRRRKTKCDGGSPCHYCRTNNVECVNHIHERRQQALSKAMTQQQGRHQSNSTAVPGSSLAHACKSSRSTSTTRTSAVNGGGPAAMDRIEDRIRRIERLMTAFSPNSTTSKMDSADNRQPTMRGFRHSTHEFRATSMKREVSRGKEQEYPVENMSRFGSMLPPTTATVTPLPQTSFSALPTISKQEPVSIYNNGLLPSPPNSTSSTLDNYSSSSFQKDHKNVSLTGAIPSLMDQLSDRTFPISAVDRTATQYPIYPLISSPPPYQPLSTNISSISTRQPEHLP